MLFRSNDSLQFAVLTGCLRIAKESIFKAMAQVDDMGYVSSLLEDGMERILKYGIACHKKKCMVQVAGFPPSAMV